MIIYFSIEPSFDILKFTIENKANLSKITSLKGL